jgi:hypothetical protein
MAVNTIKDPVFKEGVSFTLVIGFVLYNIMMASTRTRELISDYPTEIETTTRMIWVHHYVFFFKTMLSVYMWTAISLGFTTLMLVFLKMVVLNILKMNGDLFTQMTNGKVNGVLKTLSDQYKKQDAHDVTLHDVVDLVISFVMKKEGYVFVGKVIAGSVLVTGIFASLVKPEQMNSRQSAMKYTRLMFITVLVQVIFMIGLFMLGASSQ